MKFTKTIALALAAGVVASAAFAEEEANTVGAYAGTVLKNGYISNGYLFADDFVLQSYAGVTFGGFDLNIWNSWDIEKSHFGDAAAANEIDYELDYGFSAEDFDFGLGVAAWDYPNSDGDNPDEWVAKASVAYTALPIRPELNARFGLHGQQGCYGQFKLSKGFDLSEDVCEGLSADVYGLIGLASKSYRKGKGEDKDGLVDAEFGAKLTYALGDNASINAGVQYAVIVDSDLRDCCSSTQADGDKDHFMYFAGADIWF